MQELGDLQGIKPVCNEKFGVNDTDMTSQLNKMQGRGRRYDRGVGAGHAARSAHAQHGEDQLLPY